VNISAPFTHRPVATTSLMAALLLLGSIAYFLLPGAPLPQVDFPTIVVTAQSPGASPVAMALSVAAPLERQFAQISGVSRLASSSGIGATTIMIQFARTRDIDAAAQDVQSAIDAVAGQLPRNLPSPPTYTKIDAAQAKGAPTRTMAAQPGAPIQ
jgi:multidrug efflux pump subunit AcrB